jgi:beta-lactamase regulating signal transducer with metallopeptidase domain
VSPAAAVAREWALHLFQMTIQGTFVAALLLAAAAAARRWSPRFRSALLAIALAKFVLPPMLPFPTGVFSRFDASPRTFFSRVSVEACAVIAAVHLAGAAVALARLALEGRRARGWVERSRVLSGTSAATAGVRISTEAPVPCAVGGSRPAILLPERLVAALSEDEIEAVILHEREHLERRDPAMNAFESIVAAFWWFHPIVRLLVARRREFREQRCDDAVSRRVHAPVYARALTTAAALAGIRRPVGTVAAAGPAEELERRVRRLFDPHRDRRRGLILSALALAAAAALFLPGVRPAMGPAVHAEKASR